MTTWEVQLHESKFDVTCDKWVVNTTNAELLIGLLTDDTHVATIRVPMLVSMLVKPEQAASPAVQLMSASIPSIPLDTWTPTVDGEAVTDDGDLS